MFDQLTNRLDTILRNLRGLGKITDMNIRQTTREIRRVLLDADVNYKVAHDLIKRVQERAVGIKVVKSIKPGELFIKIIRDELVELLGEKPVPLSFAEKPPTIILMAGLQGSGKTTTCAKLARYLKDEGKSVLLVAADIYRPAAINQLKALGQQIGVPVYSEEASDPVTISRNAGQEAKANKSDVVILDTAGRLHVNEEMMVEIQAIAEVMNPTESLFVVDGMAGQDAVNSALAFSEAIDLTGTILTKMEGDARGGVAISITEVTGKPIKFIGISEKLEGLEVFNPQRIVDRILGFGDVISLVEKAQTVIDEKEAHKIQQKLAKNQLTLDDFKLQLRQMRKLGPLDQLLALMPGMNRKILKGLQLNEDQLVWTEAIINSMTPNERRTPRIINGSRRQRIASGSGRSVQEVNQLLKQFAQIQKMMRKMGNAHFPNFTPSKSGIGTIQGFG